MSDYLPGTYNWPSAVSGDQFPGFTNFAITVGGVAPAANLASVLIHFRRNDDDSTGTPVLALSTEDGTIVIEDAANWEFSIPAFDIELDPGTYYYDIRTVDALGARRTYVKGEWSIARAQTV